MPIIQILEDDSSTAAPTSPRPRPAARRATAYVDCVRDYVGRPDALQRIVRTHLRDKLDGALLAPDIIVAPGHGIRYWFTPPPPEATRRAVLRRQLEAEVRKEAATHREDDLRGHSLPCTYDAAVQRVKEARAEFLRQRLAELDSRVADSCVQAADWQYVGLRDQGCTARWKDAASGAIYDVPSQILRVELHLSGVDASSFSFAGQDTIVITDTVVSQDDAETLHRRGVTVVRLGADFEAFLREAAGPAVVEAEVPEV